MDKGEKKFRAYVDRYGKLHITQRQKSNKEFQNYPSIPAKQYQHTQRECAVWLKFITIFWNTRVLKTAVKFGLAALIMNRYERIGFAILMLCVALCKQWADLLDGSSNIDHYVSKMQIWGILIFGGSLRVNKQFNMEKQQNLPTM